MDSKHSWELSVLGGNCSHHTQNMGFGIQRASSSSYTPPRWKYDVFLSFRGEDTRMNFTDHLYAALIRAGITVFKDDIDLERGRLISRELLQAIDESEFFIIVFSENYASSTWCLDELAKIAECINTRGQTVIPIFYKVEPSVVRKQVGSFGEAFIKHEETFRENVDKVQTWREALSKVANISGWDVKDRHESKFIEDIVNEISRQLSSSTFINLKELIGIESRIQELMTLISAGSDDVRMIGIWGMGGIGKTTIARVIYDLISSQFEGSSFLADIRETSEKGKLIRLQKQLLFQTLRGVDVNIWDVDTGTNLIRKRLRSKKVLIVLDDVAHVNDVNKLAGERGWFGSGSRIIITTRNEQVLILSGVDWVYKAKLLDDEDALQLFCLKAFKAYQPREEYLQLSKSVVRYAGGLPLALEVLGSFLFRRDVDDWKSALERLTRDSGKDIIDKLQISFNGLTETGKSIFLDIACFFKGMDRGYVTRILDACGFSAQIGINVLIEKSLLNISKYNELQMHDLLQEMGQKIVERESPKEPGKRSRLWKEEDIHYVLTNNKGTEIVEGIMLNSPKKEVRCSANAFSKMINLRILQISGVQLSEGRLDCLSHELRLLDWNGYSLESLSPKLQLDKVVELNLDGSRIKQIPKEIKFLNMTSMSFSNCQYMKKLPDFRCAPNLEEVILDGCKSLCEVHSSLLLHENIKFLYMEHCTSLRTLPKKIRMKKLEQLSLARCSNLKNFPEVVESMDHLLLLDLSGTAIEELPSSIELLSKIIVLYLIECKNLVCLPVTINALKSLERFRLDSCSKLQNLSIGQVETLNMLEECGIGMRQPISSFSILKNLYDFRGERKEPPSNPSSVHSLISLMRRSSDFMAFRFPSLMMLDLSHCRLAEGAIPSDFFDSFPSVKKLWLSENNFVTLPPGISHLRLLKDLRLDGCRRLQSLPELPSNVQVVNVNDCVSLETVSIASSLYNSKWLEISCVNCTKLMGCDMAFSMLKVYLNKQGRSNLEDGYDHSENTTFSVVVPGSEIPEWFSHQSGSAMFAKGPTLYQTLRVEWPPHFCNRKLLGFVFGYVFCIPEGFYSFNFASGEYVSGGSTVNFPGYNFSAAMLCRTLVDHLWLLYLPCCVFNGRYKSRTNHIDVSFARCRRPMANGEFKVSGFHPVYEDDVEEFNKIDDESRFWNVHNSPQDLVGNKRLNQILTVQGLWV